MAWLAQSRRVRRPKHRRQLLVEDLEGRQLLSSGVTVTGLVDQLTVLQQQSAPIAVNPSSAVFNVLGPYETLHAGSNTLVETFASQRPGEVFDSSLVNDNGSFAVVNMRNSTGAIEPWLINNQGVQVPLRDALAASWDIPLPQGGAHIAVGLAGTQDRVLAPQAPWTTFRVTTMDVSTRVTETGVPVEFTALFFEGDGDVTAQAPVVGSPGTTYAAVHIGVVAWIPSDDTVAQSINLVPTADKTYGDADFTVSATASSGLPVSFTATGPITVAFVNGAWVVHIDGAGTGTITAHQAGDCSHQPSPDVSQTFAIARTNARITVDPYSVTFNGTTFTAAGEAFGVNGERLAGLNLSGTAHAAVGDYPADPWTFTDSTGNYKNAGGTVHDKIGAEVVPPINPPPVTPPTSTEVVAIGPWGTLRVTVPAGKQLPKWATMDVLRYSPFKASDLLARSGFPSTFTYASARTAMSGADRSRAIKVVARNRATLDKLKPGNYHIKYRVEIVRGQKVVTKTPFMPARKINLSR